MFVAASLTSLALPSCTKSSDPSTGPITPTAPSLNSMENALVGKWYYTEIRDSNYNMSSNHTYVKTDFTNEQDVWYLEFTPDFSYTIPNINHHAKVVRGYMDASNGTPSPTSVWYFDETSKKLNFFGGSQSPFQYDIVVNGRDLSMRLDYMNTGMVYTCKLRKQ